LRRWQSNAELTQRDLAAKLKKPPSYVHKTEVGDRRIDPIEMVLRCRACKLKLSAAVAELEKEI
jgi:predicted transcriptional regulator